MQARRRRSSLRDLVLRTSGVLVAAALVLAAPGCHSSTPEEGVAEQDAGEVLPPRSGVELRAIVNALVEKMGEDAYADPSLDPIVEELTRAALAGDEDAKSVRGLVIAKRRLARAASSGEKTPFPARVDRGVTPMQGPAPKEPLRVQEAESVGVGASRSALIEAYGECLVLQTWFRARDITDMTRELFHVAPNCRDRLTPRVFTVGADQVIRVSPGDLDHVMRPSTQD